MIIETTLGKYRVQSTYVFADIHALRAACPDFFVQKGGLWYWAKTQTEFFNALNGKDYMRFPENVRLVRETKERILATLQIIKSK